MKKIIIPLLAAVAVLSGCSAIDSQETKVPSGKKMTLTASIPSSDTKVVYSENMTSAGLELKATWSDRDTISVVTLGTDLTVIAIDDFVCEGAEGSTKAVFTGVVSADPDEIVTLTAVYPRMDPSTASNAYETVMTVFDNGYLYLYSSDGIYEEEPSEMERLAKAAVLIGKVESTDDDQLSVSLQHQNTLVKCEIEVGKEYAGMSLNKASMYLTNSQLDQLDAMTYAYYDLYTGEINYEHFYDNPGLAPLHYTETTDCSHVVDEDGILTCYLMLFPTEMMGGGYLYNMFYLIDEEEEEMVVMEGLNAIGKDITLEAGKVYTVSGWMMDFS